MRPSMRCSRNTPSVEAGIASAWCWAGKLRTNSSPSCSSRSKTRVPACLPESTEVGSEPKNAGVITIWSPSTKQLMMRWWPSICQPHGSSRDGRPKMLIQYSHSPYSSSRPVISRSASLSFITSRAVRKPWRCRWRAPGPGRARAALRCSRLARPHAASRTRGCCSSPATPALRCRSAHVAADRR